MGWVLPSRMPSREFRNESSLPYVCETCGLKGFWSEFNSTSCFKVECEGGDAVNFNLHPDCEVCIPGYMGLYAWNSTTGEWNGGCDGEVYYLNYEQKEKQYIE